MLGVFLVTFGGNVIVYKKNKNIVCCDNYFSQIHYSSHDSQFYGIAQYDNSLYFKDIYAILLHKYERNPHVFML